MATILIAEDRFAHAGLSAYRIVNSRVLGASNVRHVAGRPLGAAYDRLYHYYRRNNKSN
jgi:hypothetical protein